MPSPTEAEILEDLLIHGANSPSGLAENVSRTRPAVSKRLKDLTDKGLVFRKAPGVYGLTLEGVRSARAIAHERDSGDEELGEPPDEAEE